MIPILLNNLSRCCQLHRSIVSLGILLVFAQAGYGQQGYDSFRVDRHLFPKDHDADFRKLATHETDSVQAFLYRKSADFIDYMEKQTDLTRENGCWKYVDWIARDSQTYAQPVMDSTWTRGLPDSNSDKLYILNFLPDYEAPHPPPMAHIGIAYRGQFWNWNKDNVYIEKLGMLIIEDYSGKMAALRFIMYFQELADLDLKTE